LSRALPTIPTVVEASDPSLILCVFTYRSPRPAMNSMALSRALASTGWQLVSATSTAAPSRAGFLALRCYATRAAKSTTTATATTPKATAATKKTTTTTKKNVSTTTAASKKNVSAKATLTTAKTTAVAASSTTPKATKTVKKTATSAAATKTAATAATKKTATNKAATAAAAASSAVAPKAPTTSPTIATLTSAPNPTSASALTQAPTRHVAPTSPLPPHSPEQEVRTKLNPNSKEYRKAYGTAARKWTSAMVAMPILLVTSYYLFDRLALGNKPKVMPDLEGTRKHAEVEAEAAAQANVV
ncbi:hypothetical protein CT0861_10963, partial [Colletotrichum tofieldiae]